MNDRLIRLSTKISLLSFLLIGCEQASFAPMMPVDLKDLSLVPSPQKSSIQITGPNYADGTTPAKIIITIKNSRDEALPNIAMSMEVTGDQNTLVPCPPTDQLGQSICWLYSTRAEIKTVIARGVIILSKTAQFQPLPAMTSLTSITSSGELAAGAGGHRAIHSTGLIESPIVLKDSTSIRRMRASIYGTLVDD